MIYYYLIISFNNPPALEICVWSVEKQSVSAFAHVLTLIVRRSFNVRCCATSTAYATRLTHHVHATDYSYHYRELELPVAHAPVLMVRIQAVITCAVHCFYAHRVYIRKQRFLCSLHLRN